MCIQMCALSPVFMWVCVCVFLAQGRCTDEGIMRGNAKEQEEEAQGVPRLRVVGRRISAVTLSRVSKRKGWPVIIQTVAHRSAIRTKIKTHSPFLLCYFVCLDQVECCMVGGFAQGKSGEVEL